MRILTTATEVASVDDEFAIDGDAVPAEYLSYDLNEWDDYAIEAAVQIKEARENVEVVAVTIGPERSEEVVREALAKGADRALRVWDDTLEDRAVLDPTSKAQILAAVAETEEPDLVLAGVQSGEDAWGATGVALARDLGYQWAAVVNDLELDDSATTAHVHRELEGGVEELTEVDLPAVLTIQTGINDPRYASLRGIRQAHAKPLDVQSLSDLGLDAPPERLRHREMRIPESESETEYLSGSPDEQASQLATVLTDEGVIDG
ncbi:electron transfer flavoprotein subunit beta/FixA family protein [Halobellus marinus]|uniref:electron transfer flavoprotein subunit beta/FixA family protein n=1 Tax=Halobellus TaxID=1073986 RepID=UPI0028ADF19E|nr:electron transfer flavoprotein subunit beta/FixA family protein [Halobellus sp. DFY28]